jgi:hypothetical protein
VKDLRLEDAAAAEPSLSPCLRCLGHYRGSFGERKAVMCRFRPIWPYMSTWWMKRAFITACAAAVSNLASTASR